MPKLTKSLIDNTQPAAADVWVWDTELPGFGIRVQPSGRKTYVTRYRTQEGTQRKQTLARCADMPPDRARDLARKTFAAVAEGKDPMQDRTDARNAPTVEEMKERYMKEHARPFKKDRSVTADETNWRLHILPALGSKKVRAVSKADVLALHGSLSEKPAVANQVLALLSKAFNLCEVWEYRAPNTNPCKGVRKYQIKERETILDAAEIRRLHVTLDQMVDEGVVRPPLAWLIRLLMLTGCRLTEIMHAERAWVDEQRSLLLLPDSKVGQRKIALSAAAMAIIRSMPAHKWLIPGKVAGEPMVSPYKQWGEIKRRARLPRELRFHDLRHTAGSLAHMAGLSQREIAIMLGHSQLSTTERYLHGHKGGESRIVDTLANVITSSWAERPKPATAH